MTEVGKRLRAELVPTIALELYLKYLLTLLFTNLNLIGVISLVEPSVVGVGGKTSFSKHFFSECDLGCLFRYDF